MANFLKNSNVRFGILSIHLILLTLILSILANVSKDIVALSLGHPMEYNTTTYVTFAVLIWLYFALQSNKYKKEE